MPQPPAGEQLPDGQLPVVPDLVLEVVSRNDLYVEVRRKLREYIHAAVRLLWVVEPDLREVKVWRGDGSIAVIHGSGELDGEDVLPGFRCALEMIFPPRPEATSEPQGQAEEGSSRAE